jgi:capsular polysaccharide export protein
MRGGVGDEKRDAGGHDGAAGRRFLLLQGPHGPFFRSLGAMLARAGAQVWRVGFNRGDQVMCAGRPGFLPYHGTVEDWPTHLDGLVAAHGITDIVLYGDTRPAHAAAVTLAAARGITVHVFEEGYIRPYWVTYERGGSNGHSRLMRMRLEEMQAALAASVPGGRDVSAAPARWGEMRQHIFWGAVYHFCVLVANRPYARFRPHREIGVAAEFRLYLLRLLFMPLHWLGRALAEARVRFGGFPYHLVLLQLEHDASFRAHSRFATMADFVEDVAQAFAKGAPAHHHLVFKAHPLEDGRAGVAGAIRAAARAAGIGGRVHFVRGGKLAGLLGQARTAVTVNSTAGQQALWRGVPLKALGEAIYAKPGLVSDLPLADFFRAARRPDPAAYRRFRAYLLETSQVSGGFYATLGRRRLIRQIVDMMLAAEDPYDALSSGKAAPRQHLSVVR